jgi:transposase
MECEPPDDKSIRRWYRQFRGTGSVEKRYSTGRPRRSDEDVDHVMQAFIRSPKKSISQANA